MLGDGNTAAVAQSEASSSGVEPKGKLACCGLRQLNHGQLPVDNTCLASERHMKRCVSSNGQGSMLPCKPARRAAVCAVCAPSSATTDRLPPTLLVMVDGDILRTVVRHQSRKQGALRLPPNRKASSKAAHRYQRYLAPRSNAAMSFFPPLPACFATRTYASP